MPTDPDLYLKAGLDWDLIRARYLKSCSVQEREDQLYSLSRQHHALKKIVKPQSQRQYPNVVPHAKIELMLKYYEVGNKVPWIATELELSNATVRKHLESRGVYDATRDLERKK